MGFYLGFELKVQKVAERQETHCCGGMCWNVTECGECAGLGGNMGLFHTRITLLHPGITVFSTQNLSETAVKP